ncbi:MAG: hypothetical protein U0869_10535 [Chloroflexota bacterium]
MSATVQGILLSGAHAARPAASGVSVGTLYSCSDHGLVYQTNGTAWSTWATLGTTLTFGAAGDISASAPGDAAAAGATGKVTDAGHRHPREAAPVFGAASDLAATLPGDTASGGATGKYADAGHRHPRLGDTFAAEFTIDGGGAAITTGIKGDIHFPFAWTINQVTLLADAAGSIVIDLWKASYASYPPTVANTITAAAKPTLATAAKSKDATLTGWTTAVAADDVLRINVDSAATVQRVLVALKGTRV